MIKLKIQSVLYEHTPEVIAKFVNSLLLNDITPNYAVTLHLGDCSKAALLDQAQVDYWVGRCAEYGWKFKYSFFNENLGPANGHNRLYFPEKGADRLLIINPDSVTPFHMLERVNRLADNRSDWGVIEGRQIPFEHPKKFNPDTLETLSLTTACALFHAPSFEEVEGFDPVLWMYGDDIDIGWKVMALKRKLYYAIDTFIYHTKRIDQTGILRSRAERIFLPLNWLILWEKYGQPELGESWLEYITQHAEDPVFAEVLRQWEILKPQIIPATDEQKAVAIFEEGTGAPHLHRWTYDQPKEDKVPLCGNKLFSRASEPLLESASSAAPDPANTPQHKLFDLGAEFRVAGGGLVELGEALREHSTAFEKLGLHYTALKTEQGLEGLEKQLDEAGPVDLICVSDLGGWPDPEQVLKFLGDYARRHKVSGLLLAAPNLSHQDVASRLLAGHGMSHRELTRYFTHDDLLELTHQTGWALAQTRNVVQSRSGQHDQDLLLHKPTLAGDAVRMIAEIFNPYHEVEYFVWLLRPASVGGSTNGKLPAGVAKEVVGSLPGQAVVEVSGTQAVVAGGQAGQRPAVSVLIRTTGVRYELLTECLFSVHVQDCPAEKYEVVIALHTLQEDPAALTRLQKFLTKFPPELQGRIKFVTVTGHGGHVRPTNALLEAATGQYMFYLDDDDLLVDNGLPSLIEGIERYGHETPILQTLATRRMAEVCNWRVLTGTSLGQAYAEDEKGVPVAGKYYSDLFYDPDVLPRTYPYTCTKIDMFWGKPFKPIEQNYNNVLPPPSYAIPRELVEQTNIRFDQDFIFYNDWDFLMRSSTMFKVVTLPVYTSAMTIRNNKSQTMYNSELVGAWMYYYDKCVWLREKKPLLLEGRAAREIVEKFQLMEELQQTIKWQEAQLWEKHQALTYRETESPVLAQQLRETQAYVRSLESALHNVQNSPSWRLTAPLRKARSALGRLLKG